jgi:hypothetical protein
MHTYLRASIIVVTFVVAFLLGYNISSQSGTEPGYFEATEAGAYGSVEESASPTGLGADDSEYYKSLLNE